MNFPAFEVRLVEGEAGLQAGEAALRPRSKLPFHDIEYFGFGSAIVAIYGLLKTMLQSKQAAHRAEMTVGQPQNWPAIAAEIGFPVRFEAAENQIIFPKLF